ncbi:MAG: hypothetical protein IMW93_06255 [Thermoanaerobacteraceae bacterium]|nr:hypothetical protein [Thermoanaerobacteraceae bacterium]
MSLLDDEVKNIRQVISLISSLKTDCSDHWPEDIDRILLKNVTLQKDGCNVIINGFSVLDLLDAIKAALRAQ